MEKEIIDGVLRKFMTAPRQPGYLKKPEYKHLQESYILNHPEDLFINEQNKYNLYINKLELLNPLNILSKEEIQNLIKVFEYLFNTYNKFSNSLEFDDVNVNDEFDITSIMHIISM